MHDNEPLEWTVGDGSGLTMVLAHGRGAEPESMIRNLVEPLKLENARVLVLRADNSAWYPESFLADFDENEPWLSAALAYYERVVAGLIDDGVAAEKIVVGGFSQGACLTSEWLGRHPRRLRAALVLTGGRIGPEGTTWDGCPELGGMPVYQSSSPQDPWIPEWRARETAEWFRASEARLTLDMFDGREHTISAAEVDTIRTILVH